MPGNRLSDFSGRQWSVSTDHSDAQIAEAIEATSTVEGCRRITQWRPPPYDVLLIESPPPDTEEALAWATYENRRADWMQAVSVASDHSRMLAEKYGGRIDRCWDLMTDEEMHETQLNMAALRVHQKQFEMAIRFGVEKGVLAYQMVAMTGLTVVDPN